MKYLGLSDSGKFVTITIEEFAGVAPPEPTKPPKPVHKIKEDKTKDPPEFYCSCGADAYRCKCNKVLCETLTPSKDGLCPNCAAIEEAK